MLAEAGVIGLYLLIGSISGLLAGLFGIGGGLVIVPALVAVFALGRAGVPESLAVHVAIGSSLAVIVFTSISSLLAHHRRGAVVWPAVLRLVPGVLIGGFIGARVADAMSRDPLQGTFGALAVMLALWMAFGRPPPTEGRSVAGLVWLPAGGVIGALSALAGIGGGVLTVPWLTWQGVPIHKAVGSAAACTFPVALAGAAGFVITGLGRSLADTLPAGAVGYVYLPAVAGIALVSVFTAPLGARLAHALPVNRLRRAFAVLLALIGLRMLVGALT